MELLRLLQQVPLLHNWVYLHLLINVPGFNSDLEEQTPPGNMVLPLVRHRAYCSFRAVCSATSPVALQVSSRGSDQPSFPRLRPLPPGTNPDFSPNFFFRPLLLFLSAADQLQGHSLPANSFPYLGLSG